MREPLESLLVFAAMKVVALAGGVGAAKFLRGLVLVNAPRDLTVVGNTGDDAIIHGLHISPDLDILAYSLAGLVGKRGWGYRDDSSNALEQMRVLGADTWFFLGDRDLGTHMARTGWLSEGIPLSQITERIATGLGLEAKILPMTDDRVSTKLVTEEGVEREFQEYFVKYGHKENIREVFFDGADQSAPAPGVIEAIASAERIVICPSNPLLSIGPILAVPGIYGALASRKDRVVGISPIVEGAALKGPADRLLPVWGAEASASGVASLYADICSTFVVDNLDADEAGKIRALGLEVVLADTVMKDDSVARRLAEATLSSPPGAGAAMPEHR